MSKVNLSAVAELLAAMESGTLDSPAARWLAQEQSPIDELTEEDALIAVETAKRMGLSGHLVAAKASPEKRVRKAASRAIHALRSAGQDVQEKPREAAGWSMGSEERDIPAPVALLGIPQGDGYFPFIMLAYGRDSACVCAGVAGAGQGFQDSDHAHVGRSKARDIIENARRDHNLVEVPFHVALHLVERAFEEGSSGQPHGWGHMLESVPEGVKNTARLVDPLQKQESELDSDALHAADALLEGKHRVVFNLEERISGPAIDSVMNALTSQLVLNDDEKRRRVADEVVTAVNAAFDGHARRTWTLAMDVLAAISDIAGWQDERRAARHISLALQAGRPGADIPFFRIWTERQLAAVSEMIMSVRSDREQDAQ